MMFGDIEGRQQTAFEGFERASPLDDYSGNVSSFSIATEWATEGSKSLESSGRANGNDRIYTDAATLDTTNYPRKGTQFRFDFRTEFNGAAAPTSFSFIRLHWAYEISTGHGWYIELDIENSNAELWYDDSGGATRPAADFSVAYPQDEDCWVDITWDDGTLGGSDGDVTVDVYDSSDTKIASTLTANTTTITDQDGIQWGIALDNTTHEYRVDNLRLV